VQKFVHLGWLVGFHASGEHENWNILDLLELTGEAGAIGFWQTVIENHEVDGPGAQDRFGLDGVVSADKFEAMRVQQKKQSLQRLPVIIYAKNSGH
jgi:hypothetical protein